MPGLLYRCPHCGEEVEASEDQYDQTIPCPHCHHKFRLEAPVAKPVATAEPNESVTEDKLREGDASTEKTLEVLHPAMFRKHPLRWIGLMILMIGGVVGGVIGLGMEPALGAIGLIVALLALGYFGWWWLAVRNITLTITTVRSIKRVGIISKETTEVRHKDVRNLQVDQRILERLLGVGDIAISSAGQDDMEIRVDGINDPDHVAGLIREQQHHL